MPSSIEFLNPNNKNYDDLEAMRDYYQKVLFPKIREKLPRSIQKKQDVIKLMNLLEVSLEFLEEEAIDNYACKVAYGISLMLSGIKSDKGFDGDCNFSKKALLLSKLYRLSNEADRNIDSSLIEDTSGNFSHTYECIKGIFGEDEIAPVGVFFLCKAMQASISKERKKKHIKLIGESEYLSISIKDLQLIWDNYKALNPDYKEVEPKSGPISNLLPLQALLKWSLYRGLDEYVEVIRTKLGFTQDDVTTFAAAMEYDIDPTSYYASDEGKNLEDSIQYKLETTRLCWALRNKNKKGIEREGKEIGLTAKEIDSLAKFYAVESAKNNINSPTRTKSILFQWALKDALCEYIDYFKTALGIERDDVLDYAVAMNYDVYGALIYSSKEGLSEQVNNFVARNGWREGKNLDKLSEFLSRAIEKDNVSEIEALVTIPRIWKHVLKSWKEVISFVEDENAFAVKVFLERFQISHKEVKSRPKKQASEKAETPKDKTFFVTKRKEEKPVEYCKGIKPLTETDMIRAEKKYGAEKKYQLKNAPDSGLDASSSSEEEALKLVEWEYIETIRRIEKENDYSLSSVDFLGDSLSDLGDETY